MVKKPVLGKKWFRSVILVGFSLVFSLMSPLSVSAKLTATQLYEYAQINALFYDPDGTDQCVTVGSINGHGESDGSDVNILGDAAVLDGIMTDKIRQKLPNTNISTANLLSDEWSRVVDVPGLASRPILVLAFGSNNSVSGVQAFIELWAGQRTKVFFVTAYGSHTLNNTLRTLAQNNSNISLIDFDAAANANASSYISGSSLTAAGYDMYSRMVIDAVNGATTMNRSAGVNGSVGLSDEQIEFVDKYHDIAAGLSLQYGIPWEAVMAQGILESASGTSNFAVNRNNFFGIGAFDSNPDNAYRFDTPEEGWRGYYENIRRTSVYRNNGVFQGATVTDPYEYIVAVKQAGYATDERYVAKLHAIIPGVEELSRQRGWASSAQIAAAHPEWYTNAAKNAEGAGEAPSGGVNYSGFYCYDESTTPSSGGGSGGSAPSVPPTIIGAADRPVTSVGLSQASSVACDDRTTDIGVYTGHLKIDGIVHEFSVRLCKLDKEGYQIHGNDGGLADGSNFKSLKSSYVPVNSIVSGAFAALAHDYYNEFHKALEGTSGYRTQSYQTYLSKTNSGAAAVGNSKHEAGLAIDITTGCNLGIKPGECGTQMDRWLTQHVGGYGTTPGGYGLTRPVSNEAWHVQMSVREIRY